MGHRQRRAITMTCSWMEGWLAFKLNALKLESLFSLDEVKIIYVFNVVNNKERVAQQLVQHWHGNGIYWCLLLGCCGAVFVAKVCITVVGLTQSNFLCHRGQCFFLVIYVATFTCAHSFTALTVWGILLSFGGYFSVCFLPPSPFIIIIFIYLRNRNHALCFYRVLV